jgi:hypothetical protein
MQKFDATLRERNSLANIVKTAEDYYALQCKTIDEACANAIEENALKLCGNLYRVKTNLVGQKDGTCISYNTCPSPYEGHPVTNKARNSRYRNNNLGYCLPTDMTRKEEYRAACAVARGQFSESNMHCALDVWPVRNPNKNDKNFKYIVSSENRDKRYRASGDTSAKFFEARNAVYNQFEQVLKNFNNSGIFKSYALPENRRVSKWVGDRGAVFEMPNRSFQPTAVKTSKDKIALQFNGYQHMIHSTFGPTMNNGVSATIAVVFNKKGNGPKLNRMGNGIFGTNSNGGWHPFLAMSGNNAVLSGVEGNYRFGYAPGIDINYSTQVAIINYRPNGGYFYLNGYKVGDARLQTNMTTASKLILGDTTSARGMGFNGYIYEFYHASGNVPEKLAKKWSTYKAQEFGGIILDYIRAEL